MPMLQFAASVMVTDTDGIRSLLHGPWEATLWHAYRSLLRITMIELGRRVHNGYPDIAAGEETNIGEEEDLESKTSTQEDARNSPKKSSPSKSFRVLGLKYTKSR